MRVNLLPVKVTYLSLASYRKIALMSNISNTVIDTTMGSMEVKNKTTPELSIGTMTFDLG